MERKPGDVFIEPETGDKIKCVSAEKNTCEGCCFIMFLLGGSYCFRPREAGYCSPVQREDKAPVRFEIHTFNNSTKKRKIMEHSVGTQVTDKVNKVTLQVKAAGEYNKGSFAPCDGCFYNNYNGLPCGKPIDMGYCDARLRIDATDVIFVEE